MRLHHWFMVAVALCFAGFIVAVGCTRDVPTGATFEQARTQAQVNPNDPVTPTKKKKKIDPEMARFFKADLSGANEATPVETDASGMAHFVFHDNELRFALFARDIEEVIQAHIHLGPPGVNGGVVLFLKAPGENFSGSGLVAEGVVTGADLVGDLAGETLWDLIDEIEANNAYVNVHTVANPSGEIRGQIEETAKGPPAKKKKPPKGGPPPKKKKK